LKNINQIGFTFDLNKCVGCQACHIACSIENDLGYDFSWREINTYNPDQIENLPHYHFSMACNHCREPICMVQCPAQAINKNPENGIVLIDENKCIGCKFCSWVCPFDAPKYNPTKNLMTKCTFCNHRIEESLEPACVSICPTDALNIKWLPQFIQPKNLGGFPESNLQPAIDIKQINPDQSLPQQYTQPYSKEIIENYEKSQSKIKNKIAIANDWTLILLTLLISVLGGWLSTKLFRNVDIDPLHFLGVGLMGMGLSTMHLGKKFLAWRAILNWRTSWLSREVIFFSSFLFLALLYLSDIFPSLTGLAALATGYIAAIAADHIYHVIAKTDKKFFHSAQVWLSYIFLVCFFNHVLWGVYLFGFIKIFLFLQDKFQKPTNYLFLFLRITTFITAIFFLLQSYSVYSFILIILSELIDRIEFYHSLEIITPRNHINNSFFEKIE
jgi:DMSO reductase iron-sulfur subunit